MIGHDTTRTGDLRRNRKPGDTPGMVPETHFAWHGDVSLAYQVIGEGATDLLYIPGWLSNVDIMWESPEYETFLRRLAGFTRLIVMDRRGYGCSERFSPREVEQAHGPAMSDSR